MDDTISRKAAIDAITRKMVSIPTAGEKDLMDDVNRIRAEDISVIKRLPSAQPEHTSNNDCNGCKFVGCYDTGFPCANCIRKNKDYYTPERRTDESDANS